VISGCDHDRAQGQADDEKGQRLQTIEKLQKFLPK
jgi:hypothetical protein